MTPSADKNGLSVFTNWLIFVVLFSQLTDIFKHDQKYF